MLKFKIENFIRNLKLEIRIYFKVAICVAVFCLCYKLSSASDINPIYSIRIDEATIERGYEVKGFDGELQVAVFPFVLKEPAGIELKNRTKIALLEANGGFNIAAAGDGRDAINRVSTTTEYRFQLGEDPKGWKINSDIYEFDLRDKDSYDGEKPLVVTVKYGESGTPPQSSAEGLNRQKMFYFDGGKKEWMPLPSTIMHEENAVRAIIHLSYAKVAVFENTETMALGNASWYKYKGCNCAASPDYPKGTKLKVTAINSNKTVIVEVNDYGQDRSLFPERVIDLDMEAFKILAPLGAGVIDVKVEPLDEICSYAFEKAKHPAHPAPEILSPYAAVIDEPTGEVFFEKNGSKKVPIASITKLMTASVLMDAMHEQDTPLEGGTLMDKGITYDKTDGLDGARLYVNDGAKMTEKDIFYLLLVGSANNVERYREKNTGLGYNGFIEAMNEKAKEWHLDNTEFKDPTGLDSGNKSAALDLAKMAKKVFKNFEMLRATTMPSYSFKTLNTGEYHTVKSTNELLFDKELYITGAKTGFLNEAGNCLVLKAKNRNSGREGIGVGLGRPSSGGAS